MMNEGSQEQQQDNNQNIFIEKNTETSHRSPSEVCDELPSEKQQAQVSDPKLTDGQDEERGEQSDKVQKKMNPQIKHQAYSRNLLQQVNCTEDINNKNLVSLETPFKMRDVNKTEKFQKISSLK